jgi:hypothetical protein
MSNDESLRRIVEDLIQVMHVQAKDLETLIGSNRWLAA